MRLQGRALKLVSITPKGENALAQYSELAFKISGREDVVEILRRVVVAVQGFGDHGYDIIQSARHRKIAMLQSHEAMAWKTSIDSNEFRLLARFAARAFYSRLVTDIALLSELQAEVLGRQASPAEE